MMERKEIEAIIKEHDIEFIQVEITDLNGISRSFITPVQNFLKDVEHRTYHCPIAINAFLVTGEIIDFTGTGVTTDFYNIQMIPDLTSFKPLPWIENTASVTCDIATYSQSGLDFSKHSSRQQCKAQLQKLHEMGFKMFSAYEYEFYLVDKKSNKPIYKDVNFAATALEDIVRPVAYDIMRKSELNRKSLKLSSDLGSRKLL